MSNNVVLRKNGGFYSVYGDDAFILYYLFHYKIIDDKVGFPLSGYNKVINCLEDNLINYSDSNKNISVNYKKKNNYNKFLNLGKKKHSLDFRINSIMEKINNLSENDIDEILDLIEAKLWMINF